MHARLTIGAGAAVAMLAVLSVQFLLGMGVNLTVHVAHARFGFGSMMGVMRGQPLLIVHMMIGMLAAVLALIAVLSAAASAKDPLIWRQSGRGWPGEVWQSTVGAGGGLFSRILGSSWGFRAGCRPAVTR